MHRIYIFLSLFLGFTFHLSAQALDTTKSVRYVLGFTPSALLNLDAGFQFSHDLIFKNQTFIGLETGLLFGLKEYSISSTNLGYRLRIKFGWSDFGKKIKKDILFFYNYKTIFYNISRDEIKANGAYVETVDYDRIYTFKGVGFGMNFHVKQYLKLGFGSGFGVRNNSYTPEETVQ
ncbi:MAG: hypothetical protein R2774_04585 [Saprospiraceae bacterium]